MDFAKGGAQLNSITMTNLFDPEEAYFYLIKGHLREKENMISNHLRKLKEMFSDYRIALYALRARGGSVLSLVAKHAREEYKERRRQTNDLNKLSVKHKTEISDFAKILFLTYPNYKQDLTY